MPQLTLDVHGLDCPTEVAMIRDALQPHIDEDNLRFDLINAHVLIDHADSNPPADTLIAAISRTGLKASICKGHGSASTPKVSGVHAAASVLFLMSGLLLLLAFVVHLVQEQFSLLAPLRFFAGGAHAPLVSGLLLGSTLLGASLALPKAWAALRNLHADMHVLMCTAVVGAILLGEFVEGAMVAFLFALSLRLEQWSVSRARTAITSLLELTPPEALLVGENGSQSVPVAEIPLNSVVRVLSGERIPLDGTVVAGHSAVDESPVTGESMPVDKPVNAQVFAGSINHDATIDIQTTTTADNSTVARIIKLVQDAQGRRASVERWADRFARRYTPVMIALALIVAVIPPLLLGAGWGDSVYRALVLLLIACPCALVISTPVTIVAGLSAAARNGILIKGGVYLELAATIRMMALDKTGTLTQGTPSVTKVVAAPATDADDLLTAAAAIESQSTHPLARAIVEHAVTKRLDVPSASNVSSQPGLGVTGLVEGSRYLLGNRRMIAESGVDTSWMDSQIADDDSSETSWVFVARGDHVCGGIQLQDIVRNESVEAVSDLRSEHKVNVALLTGDNWKAAREIAKTAGIEFVRAEMLPEDKASAIQDLAKEYGSIAMVGDGINDAPAMANATLGIAMGASGTDTAIETADIALMNDNLQKLPWLIGHARQTLIIIRQNIAIALGLKIAVLVLALFGLTTLWLAIVADMGASLLVIANGLRLLRR